MRLTRKLRGRDGLAAGIITALMPIVVWRRSRFFGTVFAQQVRTLIMKIQQGGLVSIARVGQLGELSGK